MVGRGQFPDKLSQHLDQQGKIILLNFYKGVPVESRAWLKSITENQVVLDVEPPNSVCLSWEDKTWLVLEETGVIWRAEVESFDLLAGRVALGKFETDNTFPDSRSVIRVEPRSNIEVAIESANHRLIEYLSDISTKGIGIRIPALKPGQVFQDGEPVIISIHLSQGKTVLPGVIRNITRSEDSYRLGVGFNAGEDLPPAITSYIAHRKDEVLQTLKVRHELEVKRQGLTEKRASSAF